MQENRSLKMTREHVYTIDQSRCTFCGGCSSVCPVLAIEINDQSSEIKPDCIACGNCAAFCPVSAAQKVDREEA